MNKAKVEACERLCREFLERAKAMKENKYAMDFLVSAYGSKESAALRCTSMELTHALADLRRPG